MFVSAAEFLLLARLYLIIYQSISFLVGVVHLCNFYEAVAVPTWVQSKQ